METSLSLYLGEDKSWAQVWTDFPSIFSSALKTRGLSVEFVYVETSKHGTIFAIKMLNHVMQNIT